MSYLHFLSKRALVLFVIFPCFFTVVNAQKSDQQLETMRRKVLSDSKVSEVFLSKERGTPSLISFGLQKGAYSREQSPTLLGSYLQLRSGIDKLVPVKETGLQNEIFVGQFQQYYKGIKVEHGIYKTLARQAELQFLAGAFYDVPTTLSVTPAISEQEALNFAKKAMGGKIWAWDDIREKINQTKNPAVIKILERELREYLPKGELVITKDFAKSGTDMRLAYKFNLYSAEPLKRAWVFVDAADGKILLYDPIIKHASVATTVTTRYAGNRQILTKQISGNDPGNGQTLVSSHPTSEPTYLPGSPTYVLIDDTRGNGIETYDLNNVGGLPLSVGALYAQAKSFTDVNNIWTPAEHKRNAANDGANEAENDDIAFDAHWGAEMVYDYWKNRQNRLSYDGNNAIIKSYIHYGPAYDNAFWNGTAMTYGDGSGSATGFRALTSLDVCGHEIGHGVCSFTADLVYEKESGAMNEGFSDIWGAAIENYAIKVVDPTLATRYKPFSIGEQIGYAADPSLRRMDNPKAKTDPDTYRGQYWINPNCTPTLANDQCGVHTNSGVLNKWFYLLTCGSGKGTGPDASYVISGADDGLRDDTTLGFNSVPYLVTGLGFDVSEKIAFITETMLTATATYNEAKDVSIAVAKAYSGDPCGQIVQSVTNAWFAVGVSPAFASPCVTTFGFSSATGLTVGEGLNTFGCSAQRTVNIPILLPANSTATITFGGTATINRDYTVSSTSISNTTGSTKQDTLKVFVVNDAVVESTETIGITVSMSNSGGNPVNTSYTITILDDDVVPVIGNDSITLINENFEAYTAQGFAGPNTWTETLEVPEVVTPDPTANGKNQWGVLDGTLSITGRLAPAGTGTLPAGNYYNSSTSQTRIAAPQIDARGLNNLRIKFDYSVQGEADPNGVDPERYGKFDYMAVAYSFDGTNYTELGPEYTFFSVQPTSGTFSATLPAILNNKQFFLAFRWVNDANAGGPISVKVDNLSLKGVPRKIEAQLSHSANEKTVPNQDVYFYSQNDGEIITRINNTGGFDYGCVTASIAKTGSSSFNLYADAGGTHKVGDRVVRVTPATNSATGNYTISLYFTEAEILAIQTASNTPRTGFYIYKVAGDFTGSTSGNTTRQPATYTAIPSNGGGIFTATFSTGFSDFALGALVPGALPVTCIDFKAVKSDNGNMLIWNVSDNANNRGFEIERSTDGIRFTAIATVNADSRNNGAYTFTDNSVNGLRDVYYRIKQSDANGETKYLCSVVRLKMDGGNGFSISPVYPNPGKGNAFVKITSGDPRKINIEIVNATGQLMNRYDERLVAGVNILSLRTNNVSAGTYAVRFRNENGEVLATQSLVRR